MMTFTGHNAIRFLEIDYIYFHVNVNEKQQLCRKCSSSAPVASEG